MKHLILLFCILLIVLASGCEGGATDAERCFIAVSSLYSGAVNPWFATTKGENVNQMLAWCFTATCLETLNEWIDDGVTNYLLLQDIKDFCSGCKGSEDWPPLTDPELNMYNMTYFDDWCEDILGSRNTVNFPYF